MSTIGDLWGGVEDGYNAADDWVKGQHQQINNSINRTPGAASLNNRLGGVLPSQIAGPINNAAYGSNYDPATGGLAPQRSIDVSGGAGAGNKNTSSPNDNGVPHSVISYIRNQNPNLSKSQAAGLFKQFKATSAATSKYPGLADFLVQKGKATDPAVMQTFYAQTVAPALAQASQAYMAGAQGGNAALTNILNNAQLPAGAKALLQAYQPVQVSDAQKMAAALQGSAVAAPQYDALINQLNQTYQAQLAARAAQTSGTSSASDTSAALVQSLLAGSK